MQPALFRPFRRLLRLSLQLVPDGLPVGKQLFDLARYDGMLFGQREMLLSKGFQAPYQVAQRVGGHFAILADRAEKSSVSRSTRCSSRQHVR